MRVLVCGGRDFSDEKMLRETLNVIHNDTTISLVIHGDADGADKLADQWARQNDVPLYVCPAAWKTYGKAAGIIRNRHMLRYGQPDMVVAFPGGRGTDDMVNSARTAGIHVKRIS